MYWDDQDEDELEAAYIARRLDLAFLKDMMAATTTIYEDLAQDSAEQALRQVAAVADIGGSLDDLLNVAHERAIAWADDHAAEIVGKTLVGGEWVDNPDAKWVIDDATRDMLQGNIKGALAEGWSRAQLEKAITTDTLGPARAETIARTELSFAHSNGTRIGWQASGLARLKYSILSMDHEHEDECDDNADAGPIPLDQPYPSGDDGYPFHVNCNCVEATIIDPDQMAKAENEDTELED